MTIKIFRLKKLIQEQNSVIRSVFSYMRMNAQSEGSSQLQGQMTETLCVDFIHYDTHM